MNSFRTLLLSLKSTWDTQNQSVRNNELNSEELAKRDVEDNISVNLASLSLTEWLIFFTFGEK
jgi:hypothetical protein